MFWEAIWNVSDVRAFQWEISDGKNGILSHFEIFTSQRT